MSVYSRKYAAIWIIASAIWIYVGVGRIARHDELGWFLCVFWCFILLYYLFRIFRPSASTQAASKESHNG